MKNKTRKNLALIMACTMLESAFPFSSVNAVENNISNGGPEEEATGTTTISMKKGTAAQSTVITMKKRTAPAAPSAEVVNPSYIDETGKITGVDDTMEYSVDNGTTWTAVAAGKTEITGLSAGKVLVRVKAVAATGYPAGASQEITVTASTVKHDGPAAPEVSAVEISAVGESDGKITGVDSTMEYSLNGTDWTAVTGTEITGLAPGEVKVRVKETATVKAGTAASVTVASTLAEAKKIAVGVITEEAGTDTAENVVAAANEAKAAINRAATTVAVESAKNAGITAIRNAKAANALAADKAAFETKKTEGKTAAAGRVTASDSEAVRNLSAEAVTAIGALTYDTTLTAAGKTTLELNKKRVDDILSELDTAIENQKALEAAEALAAAKEDAKAAVKAAGGETPSEAVTELIMEGITAVENAETVASVTAAKEEAVSKITEQIREEKLEAAKHEAKAAVTAAAGESPSEEITAIVAHGITSIDRAETVEAVTAAKAETIAEIEALLRLADDKVVFEHYKSEAAVKAAARAGENDSEAIRKIVSDTKAEIESLLYDLTLTAENKSTLELNKARVDDLLITLDEKIKAEKDIEAARTLNEIKTAAKEAVTAAGGHTPSEAVTALVKAGIEKIDKAETFESVMPIAEEAIAGITEQIKKEELEEDKKSAKAEIAIVAGHNPSEAVTALVTAGNAEIDKAETFEAVTAAMEDAIDKITKQFISEELAAEKEEAKAEVTTAGGQHPSAAVIALVTAGKAEIDRAETIEAVNAAEEAAIARITEQLRKEIEQGIPEEPSDPDTDLTVLKAVSKAEIERTAGTSPSAAVAALVSEGKAAVDAAETADEVEEAEERAISKIIDQLNREAADRASAAELAAAKEEAVNAVRKAAGERPSAAVKTIADTGVNEIINAEKVSAVRAAMNDTVSKIKAQRRTEAIKKIEGREPSHLTIGAKTYWVLDGVSYEDPECTKEITNLAEWVVIPAEGHKWNTEATVDREATCTEDGQKSVHCAGCDETKDTEVIEATGHSYGRWHITVLATGEHDGEKIRECEACHETEKAATKYNRPAEDVKPSEPGSPAEEAGKIENITKPESNACGGTISVTKSEIIETFPFSAEELEAVENGSDIGLSLEVKDVSASIPQGQLKKAERALSENQKIAAVLDVSLFRFIDSQEAGRVTQLNKALKVYISLPESIYSEDRDYVIVREHENHYTVIPLVHVSGTTYYFESDQFSTYYIAYSEKKHEHAFSEWKPSQDASWLHRGREERTCECGKKESRVVEESWTEWLYHGTVKLVKKFF